MHSGWRVELFDPLRLMQGDQVVSRFKTQKVAELVAYLALQSEKAHSREELADLLWPGDPYEARRRRL